MMSVRESRGEEGCVRQAAVAVPDSAQDGRASQLSGPCGVRAAGCRLALATSHAGGDGVSGGASWVFFLWKG